jgi:hypothetical protein
MMQPLLRMDVYVAGSFPANVATGYDLMRPYPTNDGDHARGRDRYWRVMRSALTAIYRTGLQRHGRRLLLLPLLQTDSFLRDVAVTGDVTASYPPRRNSCSSLSSNLDLDRGLNCLDYFLAH